ncbi:MAG: DegT/DnrJ/EryC1/StrS family aminotransferase [Armatimonadota bacterium]|nr:MAG: DegT/DnrJ/EryC1/StrS family aminotransferase [Armatimonadota bacterium]
MSQLAVNGGEPIAPRGLRATWPIFDDRDRQALLRALDSGNWCRLNWADPKDSEVAQFEVEFARLHDAKHCVAVANGTAAIEVALKAGGIEAGDEVLVPAVTFIASAIGIILAEAVPVFVDIDPETYQINPAAMEAAITDKTKAAVVVHYGGYPADMDAIAEIAKRRHLFIVEDCAHAHGTEWRGRKVGALVDAGAFSFQASKTLNCGEGGAVITDSEELAGKAFSYHHIGRVAGRPFYEHHIAAPNYRLTEFQGALLRSQLESLPQQTEQRHRNAMRLSAALADMPGVAPLKPDERITQQGYYFYLFRFLKDHWNGVTRDRFLEAMRAEGTPAGDGYGIPIHKNPVFQQHSFGRTGCPVDCPHHGGKVDYTKVVLPVAERVMAEEQVAIRKDLLMDAENIDLIVAAIEKIYRNRDELRG